LIQAAIRRPDLSAHRERLARRHRGEIVRSDRRSHQNKKELIKLSEIWEGRSTPGPAELAGVKTLLLLVRNGLFHGSKMYNDGFMDRETDDRQLLADLNPLLLAIVDGILGQPGPHRLFM
jgi:hypothetical protein